MSCFQATPSRRPTLPAKFKQLQESGVTLLIGTDSGIPMKFHSSSTWRELDAWVNLLGVDPMTAIRGATSGRQSMKVDRDVGTISPGKCADVIAVKGDVLRYIALLQRVDIVIKHGKRPDRSRFRVQGSGSRCGSGFAVQGAVRGSALNGTQNPTLSPDGRT